MMAMRRSRSGRPAMSWRARSSAGPSGRRPLCGPSRTVAGCEPTKNGVTETWPAAASATFSDR